MQSESTTSSGEEISDLASVTEAGPNITHPFSLCAQQQNHSSVSGAWLCPNLSSLQFSECVAKSALSKR